MWLIAALLLVAAASRAEKGPCGELISELRIPCVCELGPIEDALRGYPGVSIDCDEVVFPGEFPALPYQAPIVGYSQRRSGQHSLPTPFATAGLPLRKLDFSENSLRRLTERFLQGLQSSLLELRLADNLLGDTLNPIFSSSEFHGLNHLQILDLSGNSIKAIEEGILKGCDNLQELSLDRNSLTQVPTASLNGPKGLRTLSLRSNRIRTIRGASFRSQSSMENLDLSDNIINTIESGAMAGLEKLRKLRLSRNRLVKFNSDVFQGAPQLEMLDLSENFMSEFPSVALKSFSHLRYLNLSSNLIQVLENSDLSSLTNLYKLDLSRNNIANIAPGTFLGLKQLRLLDISVNSLRAIEDDAFEGLDNLETLLIKDNNILLIPASALGRLPRLTSLQLDYNRVAALSGDILRSMAERVTSLVLARNVVRELPPATFQYFQQLRHLDISKNLLTTLSSDAFSGLEASLETLAASQNRITTLAGQPLGLTHLVDLDLSSNHLGELPRTWFTSLVALKRLNISNNPHLGAVPPQVVHTLPRLQEADFSRIGMKQLPQELFSKSPSIERIHLAGNDLVEISEGTFRNLRNISYIDLSSNRISNMRHQAFINVMSIETLLLSKNQLTAFKGEFFNTGTSLRHLDLSDNQLSYLFPSSFRIHPRLEKLLVARNKFNFFPAELIATLQYLKYVDLRGNGLKIVEELDFARLPRLRSLLLADNQIESISEMAFHNSTQLQVLDLSGNRLERLGDRTFEGLVRLETLNLQDNQLSELPETIFERARLQMLENINLAGNRFEAAPLKALQRQYFFVSSVDLSRNRLKDIPADDSVMVNIKRLDLSFNPLTRESVANILGEPKTVRELNLAGTGIRNVGLLETPFLQKLNLSRNNISALPEKVFERTTLMEELDLSHNQLEDLGTPFQKIWAQLRSLQVLDVSYNPVVTVSQHDFEGLESLRAFRMSHLGQVARIEKGAFRALPNLCRLEAYDYPKLGYLDVQGLLQHLPALEELNIETKDPALGSDQLSAVLHPRLRELGLHGPRLRSISSGTLSGIKGSDVVIRLKNTSVTALPPALFFPVPRSSHLTLDVTGSQLTTLTPQMLVALDDRRDDLRIKGLETNPIVCDCGARALRRWLPAYMATVRCSAPDHLQGRLLVEVGDDELSCAPRRQTTPTTTTPSTTTLRTTPRLRMTTEPEIIWSVPHQDKIRTKPPAMKVAPASGPVVGNDDTLIIGIVGGVVAFIAILIIIICIIRLRMGGTQYRGGPLAAGSPVIGPAVLGAGSSCACSVKGGAPGAQLYSLPPAYAASYAATLPHKVGGSTQSLRPAYSTIGRVPYYQNAPQSYYVAFPPDEKVYR